MAYVTDAYEAAEDVIPPDSLLGRRVQQFRIRSLGDTVASEHVRAFGDTSGPGVLRVVESIAVDLPNGRLLIAEEQEGASLVKVYTLDGTFTGVTLGPSFFPNQAEGIVLYACLSGEGYWIATDQGETVNTFHVFDRKTLGHLASFRGRSVLNTDGIALTQRAFGDFPAGAFYAVHDDESLAAFSWSTVAERLGLRSDCSAAGGS